MSHPIPQENSALRPVAFLVRGLAAGLVAGLLAFAVAFVFGEPFLEDAIALEEAGASAPDGESGAAVARGSQKTWGLLTGLVLVGPALGGLTALAAAASLGRLGTLSARGSTAVVALVGFVTVALVPFWKYPATPPAVGAEDTMDSRTVYYFGFLLVSVLAGIVAVVVATRLTPKLGGYAAATSAATGYLVVVVVAGMLLPAVNEVGAFPADTLWYFRRSSLLTLAALWAGIGIVLVALVGRIHDRSAEEAERRALAASL